MRNRRFIFSLALAVLLAGCAAPGISPQAQALYDRDRALLERVQVAVVADGCVLRHEVGTSFMSRKDSERVGEEVARYAVSALAADGVRVRGSSVPLVCGALSADVLKGFELREDRDAPATAMVKYPIPGKSGATGQDIDYAHLFSAVAKAPIPAALGAKAAPTSLDLTPAEAERIQAAAGGRYVIIVLGFGNQTSFGRRFGAALLTAAVGLAATGGSTGTMLIAVDGMGFDAVLVDLKQRKLLWDSRLNVPNADPFSKASVSRQAVQGLFAPLFSVADKGRE
ncbi:MAG: hypothetical protein KGR99_17225 [Betaproteobacteria bacterium]|nr:hypothetical protein [Betaproteobacteria bacterium]MDE2154224.1 hypothetical protein [Betaproteobacteria bacterium]